MSLSSSSVEFSRCIRPIEEPARRIGSDEQALAVAAELAACFRQQAVQRDQQRQLPWAEVETLSHSGMTALCVPRSHGGADVSYATLVRVVSLISRADPSIGQLLLSGVFACSLIDTIGNPAQQAYYFAKMLQGHRWGNGHAEGGRSPAGSINTRLQAEGDGFRLNGRKLYSTGALFSHFISIGCIDDQQRQWTAVIPHDAPGLDIIDDWDGFGQRTTASGTLILDNIRIEPEQLFDSTAVRERSDNYALPDLFHSAVDLGIAQAAIEDTLDYTRHRARQHIFAKTDSILGDPYVIGIVGDLLLRLHAAEALLQRGASLLDQHRRSTDAEARLAVSVALAEAKVLTTEIALQASNQLFQLGGASSTRTTFAYDRHWRNARTHTVHDPVHWKFNLIGNSYLNGSLSL